MASEAKEMKYRRRGRVPEPPSEYGQCSDRSGALDWAALKQDPAELLRKLDEIRDQITRSCELMGQPPERHRMMSRRTVSLRPTYAEPADRRLPDHYRSRYAGARYRTSLAPSSYDQLQRSVSDEAYDRQPSGRFRQQYHEGQRESYGFAQGRRHHSACQCGQCLQSQRAVAAPPEEHILMARYFAGQQAQGSFRFDRSQHISSELDRRSVASSLYSHLSMSNRRVEYFRKKAEKFCRPMRGAAPFVVCSSCSHLLQLPQGKFTGRKKNQVQCGACSEIITFKPKEVKVHPVIQPSSFPVSKSVRTRGSNHRDAKSSGWYQHQDDDNFNFYKLQAHDIHRQKKDFADSMSLSSTTSYERTDSEHGSNRSIQLKSVPPSRSRFSNDPKDILCQGDTGSQVEASGQCTISPQGPILVDKQIDPFSSQRKDYSCGNQIKRKEYDINTKSDCEANARGESLGRKYIQKSKEGHKGGFEDEFSSGRTHEQKGRHGSINSHEGGIVGNKYKHKTSDIVTSSPEDEDMSIKYEHNGSFRVEELSQRDDKCNRKDGSNIPELESMARGCEQDSIKDDCGKLLHSGSRNGNRADKNASSVKEHTNSSSRVSSEAELDEIQSSVGKNGDSSFFTGFLKKGLKDLSLFNQSVDSAKVSINGHPISERALRKAEKKAGPVGPGSYWYDYRAGFWGVFGQECRGIIPPFIKEFNYAMPKDCAGGNTGVFVNGRELHQKDFDLLVGRGLPRIPGKSYSVEISGNVIDDTTGTKLRGLGKLAPTIEKMKRGFGMHIPEDTKFVRRSWAQAQGRRNYSCCVPYSPCSVKGSHGTSTGKILSFDTVSETFRLMSPPPERARGGDTTTRSLLELDGELAVVDMQGVESLDIWALQAEIWTLRHRVEVPPPTNRSYYLHDVPASPLSRILGVISLGGGATLIGEPYVNVARLYHLREKKLIREVCLQDRKPTFFMFKESCVSHAFFDSPRSSDVAYIDFSDDHDEDGVPY